MENIDSQALRILQGEVKEAAQEIAARHGLTVSMKAGKYNNADIGTIRMEFVVPNHEMTEARGQLIGEEFDIGFGFRYKKRDYTVIGFDAKRRKYKVIAQRDDNEEMLFTVDGVNREYRINKLASFADEKASHG